MRRSLVERARYAMSMRMSPSSGPGDASTDSRVIRGSQRASASRAACSTRPSVRAVMGSNIARNFAGHGYTVALHNRSVAKTDALLAEHGSEGSFVRTETIPEFLAALEKPRRVLIMVKAGDATDAVIDQLAGAMEPGDIIIDGGNALYTDTIRREKAIR